MVLVSSSEITEEGCRSRPLGGTVDNSMQPPPPSPGRRLPPGMAAAGVVVVLVVSVAVLASIRGGTNPSASELTYPNGGTDPAYTAQAGPQLPGNNVGEQLPDLSFTTFDSHDPIPLSKYRGRPLVINFWSSTCAPCVTEMPALQRTHEKLGDEVAFLGLDVLEGVENGRFMVNKTGVRYDIGRDPNGDLLARLGGINLPTTILVSGEGVVQQVRSGQLSEGQLTDAIREHLLA